MHMKTKQLLSVALFMLVLTPLFAQQSGIARFPLQTQEFNVPGRIAIQARVEIEPGIEGGKHTHPGLEMAYVIEGQLEVKVDGQPTRTYKGGEACSVAEGVAHAATNTGTVTTKLLATYLVEVGKPLATPFK
jgi:quercetin dioxygenase-like cupin family protein